MRHSLVVLLAIALSCAACGGSTTAGSTASNAPATAAAAPAATPAPGPLFAYAITYGAGEANVGTEIIAYSIDPATGALKKTQDLPMVQGYPPSALAVDPAGRFAYVLNLNTTKVAVYEISSSDGALKQIPGSPFPAGKNPSAVGIDPTGKFAYVASSVDAPHDQVSGFAVNGTSGAVKMIAGSPFATDSGPIGISIDPAGRFAYVVNQGSSNDVTAYRVDPPSGALKRLPGPATPGGDSPWQIVIDPSGRYAYVVSYSGIMPFKIDQNSGALTSAGAAIGKSSSPATLAFIPSGKFAYAGGKTGLIAYSVSPTNGALDQIYFSPAPAGSQGDGCVAIVGDFIYVLSSQQSTGNSDLHAYAFDPASGRIAPVLGSPFAAGANAGCVYAAERR
jgi:6-phosphogluconolactonase